MIKPYKHTYTQIMKPFRDICINDQHLENHIHNLKTHAIN